MENQYNDSKPSNVNGIILLVGAVFSGLIASVACGTVLSIIIAVIIGLIFAAFFINVLLPQRESDR